ncbi:MAG: TadE family protein [Candidatus Binatia bacterium]
MKILSKLYAALKGAKGQSIVEISLITPLLLVALYIPMDFGIAFFVSNIAGTAARDAARIGSEMGKSGGNADNRNFTTTEAVTVRDGLIPKLPAYLSDRSITVKFYEDTPADCMEVVEVTVAGDYSFFFYQVLRLFGATVTNPKTISRSAQMPYRYQSYANGTRCTGASVNVTYEDV